MPEPLKADPKKEDPPKESPEIAALRAEFGKQISELRTANDKEIAGLKDQLTAKDEQIAKLNAEIVRNIVQNPDPPAPQKSEEQLAAEKHAQEVDERVKKAKEYRKYYQ